jgi:(4S)-4-hydroxy-5-phosphonooxypentane-2,3-dione isomerase
MAFVITVKFVIISGRESEFLQRVIAQARDSLSLENECHRFDVLVDPSDPCNIFLYEIYASEEAFANHLTSKHFLSFDREVAAWVTAKTVRRWNGSLT